MPAAFLERTVFRLRFAGLLTRSQGMSPSRPSFRKDSGCKCFDTPFCGSSQQRGHTLLRKLTAAGLSGICTRFPFHPTARTDRCGTKRGKDRLFRRTAQAFSRFFHCNNVRESRFRGPDSSAPASTSSGIREHERRYPRTDTAISLPESSKKADFAAPYIRLFRRKSLLL